MNTCLNCGHTSEYVTKHASLRHDSKHYLCNSCAEDWPAKKNNATEILGVYCDRCFERGNDVKKYELSDELGGEVNICSSCFTQAFFDNEIDHLNAWTPPPADNQVGLMVTFLIIGIFCGWILNSVFTAIGGI